jgi:serine protease Do
VVGDAFLCQLPQDALKIKPLYQFLLQENYRTSSLVLSCQNQNIVLSCIMYDLDITKDGGVKVFDNLFKKADYYDDLLKNDFGCLDRIEE